MNHRMRIDDAVSVASVLSDALALMRTTPSGALGCGHTAHQPHRGTVVRATAWAGTPTALARIRAIHGWPSARRGDGQWWPARLSGGPPRTRRPHALSTDRHWWEGVRYESNMPGEEAVRISPCLACDRTSWLRFAVRRASRGRRICG